MHRRDKRRQLVGVPTNFDLADVRRRVKPDSGTVDIIVSRCGDKPVQQLFAFGRVGIYRPIVVQAVNDVADDADGFKGYRDLYVLAEDIFVLGCFRCEHESAAVGGNYKVIGIDPAGGNCRRFVYRAVIGSRRRAVQRPDEIPISSVRRCGDSRFGGKEQLYRGRQPHKGFAVFVDSRQ